MTSSMPVIQTDVENEILRLSSILETTTEEFRDQLVTSAKAQNEYRREYAKAFVQHRLSDKMSEKTSEQQAILDVEELLAFRLHHEALARGLEEKCRSLREQIGGVRTLSANVRAQT